MSISKAEHDELCCVYAALLLFDDKVEVTSDKLNKVITASGNSVEGYYPEFFAKYLSTVDLNTLLTNVGTAPAQSGPVATEQAKDQGKKDDKKAPAKKEEPKKEEPVEEEGGFMDLFG